jgi:hypothetical protein
VIVSLLFTSTAAYMGLRLLVRDQVTAGVDLQASLQRSGSESTINLTVSGFHLPDRDLVVVTVTALRSGTAVASACKGVPSARGGFACPADPCGYATVAATSCDNLVGWDIPPDSSGNVDHVLAFPFATASYQALHVITQICGRSSLTAACSYTGTPDSQLNLAVTQG